MTHLETSRVNEMLELQIGHVKDLAEHMGSGNIEQLEEDIYQMEKAVKELKGMIEGLPHKHQ